MTAVCPSPLKNVHAPLTGGRRGIFVPRAAVRPCPLERSQMPPTSKEAAGAAIPYAADRPQPLQNEQMPSECGFIASASGGGAAVCARPLESPQLPCTQSAAFHTPPPFAGTTVHPCPHHEINMPPLCGFGGRVNRARGSHTIWRIGVDPVCQDTQQPRTLPRSALGRP